MVGVIPITRYEEMKDLIDTRFEQQNQIIGAYVDHINDLDERLRKNEGQISENGPITLPITNTKGPAMDKDTIIKNIDDIANLNADGKIDKADFVMGIKYVGAIYSGLIMIISVIFGIDETTIKENYYALILLLLCSILITVGIIYLKNENIKHSNAINAAKRFSSDQTKKIVNMELDIMGINHQHQLDMMQKDFLLKIKDEMIKEEFQRISTQILSKQA